MKGLLSRRAVRSFLTAAALLAVLTGQALAAITYFASAANPSDGNSRDNTIGAVTPPGSMQVGDLVVIVANARENSQALSISNTGGQTWTSETQISANGSLRIFWARYNGTWSANPSVSFPSGANATTVVMHVFRPSQSTNTWALDVAQTSNSYAAPASPYNVTIPSITTLTNGALVLAVWESQDNNQWSSPPSGWTTAGSAQYRNSDGSDSSQATAYKIMATAGASGTVTRQQADRGPDAGAYAILAFKEIFPAPTVAKAFSPTSVNTGQTSTLTITITNPNTAGSISGLAFTDNYPSGLVNATTPTLTNTCGGTASATAGGSSLALTGGTLTAGSSCSVSVKVTAASTGSYVNSTGSVTSNNAVSSSGSSATLSVAMYCFTDDFNRADGTPAGNWVVTNEGGTFGNPRIISNRLRLTDASGGASTMAALTQLFPAANNKVIVEFDYYGYGGTGADGVAVVLSDAAYSTVPGAFGGSLGYAPKQASQGGDTTHVGFSGGWIGVAIDEYGNFSANTEGRSGGTAPGRTPDSVSVRGSGSGYTGYAYHRGSTTLTPGVDQSGATPAPGHRYRIIIDHTDGLHAYTSIERNTGSGYGYLVSPYDAKAESGQAAVPVNWYLSFTGSTGGSSNIHEIDNLQVCSPQAQVVPTLDHVRILHDGAALTCAAEDITIKACADSSCSTLYLGSVTVNMTAISGATWSANPVTFTGGQTTVSLTKTTAGTVTLGGTVTSPIITNTAASCYNGGTQTCSLTYTASNSCLDAVEVGKSAGTPIFTKMAGVAFNLDVVSLSSSAQTVTAVGLVDASSGCSASSTLLAASTTAVPSSFTANQSKTFGFTYSNAAPNVKVRITTAAGATCSSDNFAIRPSQFALSTTSALNPASDTLAAGADFNLTAASGVSSGYAGTPTLVKSLITNNATAITASTLAGSFSAAGGSSSSGTFQYHDVGSLSFATDSVIDSTFTAVDQVTGIVNGVDHGTGGDCVAGSVGNGLNGSGLYPCTIGSGTLGPIGRFKVDHFELTAQLTGFCGTGTAAFTYMDQDALGINLQVQAKSKNGTTLSRYTTGYSSLGSLTVTGDNNGSAVSLGRLSSPALATVAWTNGEYKSAATLPETHRFDGRNATPATMDGPYDAFRFKVVVNDPDGAKVTQLNSSAYTQTNATDPVYSPATKIRYGRLRLQDVYGYYAPLRVPVDAQYWSGVAWARNTLDSCTNLAIDNISGIPSGWTATDPGTLSGGTGVINLTPPANTNAASFTVCADLATTTGSCNAVSSTNTAWLQSRWPGATTHDSDPSARVSLGVFSPEGKRGGYSRERY